MAFLKLSRNIFLSAMGYFEILLLCPKSNHAYVIQFLL